MDEPKTTGTIKWWNEARGYGFITTDDYREIFAHISQVVDGYAPRKNDTVSFIEDVGRDRRPYARDVTIAK